MKVAAIVPSLNPDEKLTTVIADLIGAGFSHILLVDDGSGAEYRPRFEKAATHPQVTLLRHQVNRGKGRALKTAFATLLEQCPHCVGAVTVDGDGQHRIDDILACARELERHPDALILGARDFSDPNVPGRSSFGNKMTRGVFRWLCGLRITDTQTGLRGIPAAFCRGLLSVVGERYEFETNMLLETKTRHIPIREVPISTIYIEENASSHFHPLRDSLRIYALIFKFLSSSLLSFLVDILLFALLNRFLWELPPRQRLFLATAGARIVSSLFNFFVNHSVVFASREKLGPAMGRYYLLCAVQMLASYGGVYLLTTLLPVSDTLCKLAADTVLMLISFRLQRGWVFRHSQEH